ncbi:envelope biogenesis factor ElyC [Hafnia alvei]|uniref:envelope biogenesis factor ElyC n=1 Tax=Hafnia alvei TaxID=569 RepID=UPI00103432CF|nr:envelope biogenesis factor ElyC [Hafnia alvei]MDU3154965.1 envelope biogenesis factor ElyC [Hafnia alvei]TBL46328.1 envelope biogenesis factor ElyC [Hafnia alvei]
MLFTLKKFIGGLLLPLPLLLLIVAVGLIFICWTRWSRLGKICISLGWLGILLLSLQPVADRLLAPLENGYPTLNQTSNPDYIVVLGGGYTFNPDWAPSSNLISNSLPRVTEGIRQLEMNPNAKIIFTGAAAIGNPVSSARVAANVAESLGVPADKIIVLDKPRDTQQEAKEVAKITDKQKILLVTSANHLARALRFFKAEGLNPIPVPANQLAISSPLNPWERWLPSSLYLGHSERAWYETLGSWWQAIITTKGEK